MPSKPTLAEEWGDNLRTARLDACLTQVELAELVGMSQYTISKLEMGVHRPSDESKIVLAGAFETTVEELFPYPRPVSA